MKARSEYLAEAQKLKGFVLGIVEGYESGYVVHVSKICMEPVLKPGPKMKRRESPREFDVKAQLGERGTST